MSRLNHTIIYDSWNKRANEIVKKYKAELYDYFEGLGLIK